MTISSKSLSKVVIMLILVSFNLNVSMIDGQVAPQPIVIVVTMRNKLNDLDLQIRCDNVKTHDVEQSTRFTRDQSWSFKFIPTLFHRNRIVYNCTFSWYPGIHRFNIYDEIRDDPACHQQCNWNIKETGPCRVPDIGAPKCYPWGI
ncbi:S-protein homolog 5-like [Arachis duranensis]|uniref:S-protein homolog n=1 Tax=Arachis duranensis TaxID=130453 RepID=A0A6P4DCR0_ARADU|nr:S-protein homolog 5-like [Arachis duranensis]